MTRPTPRRELYRWHREALADVAAGLKIEVNGLPECGWFKRRLVKGGVYVPARIWMYQPTDEETGDLVGDEVLQCEVNGKRADANHEWLSLCGHPITEREYLHLVSLCQWSTTHAPDQPHANPRQPINWSTAKPNLPTERTKS